MLNVFSLKNKLNNIGDNQEGSFQIDKFPNVMVKKKKSNSTPIMTEFVYISKYK